MAVCTKSVNFWPNRRFLIVFHKMRHFSHFFAKKLIEKDKHTTLFEKLQVLAKWTIFHGFSRNEALFKSFCWKGDQNAKTCHFVRKVSSFSPNWWFFMVFHKMRNFLRLFSEKFIKREKHASFVKKLILLAETMIFHAFSGNEALFATFSWKLDQNAKTWQFVRKVSTFDQIDDFW